MFHFKAPQVTLRLSSDCNFSQLLSVVNKETDEMVDISLLRFFLHVSNITAEGVWDGNSNERPRKWRDLFIIHK